LHNIVGDTERRGDQKVRNLVIDLLEEVKVGWTPDSVDMIGEKFVRQMSNTLWYLDPHHEKFLARSIHVSLKTKEDTDLGCHVQGLSGILSQPWMAKT